MSYYLIKNHGTVEFKLYGLSIFLEKTLNVRIRSKKSNLQNLNVRVTQHFIITTESIFLEEQRANKLGFTLGI
jgi:hypothetical protein